MFSLQVLNIKHFALPVHQVLMLTQQHITYEHIKQHNCVISEQLTIKQYIKLEIAPIIHSSSL